MFYYAWCFLLLKKLILQYLEVLLTLLSRTLYFMYFHLDFCILWRKCHSFLFFYPFYRIYDIFLSSLYFLNLICMHGFLFSPGVFMESWGPCNLRKWRKFEILIAPSWRISFSLVTSSYHNRWKLLYRPECFIMCGVLQTADSKELFIILPQASHRFQSNEVPFLKLIFVYLNIKLKYSYIWT